MSVIMIGVVVIRGVVIEVIMVVGHHRGRLQRAKRERLASFVALVFLAPMPHNHVGGMNSLAVSTHTCLMEYGQNRGNPHKFI
jgi:hypothetical protein